MESGLADAKRPFQARVADFAAEHDSRNARIKEFLAEIEYFDGDTSEIHDHNGPHAWSKVERGCSVGGLLGDGCQGVAAGSDRSNQQEIGTVFILKKFDARFQSKSEFPITYSGFSDHLSQKNA
jgi:hypothetical protein